MKESALSPTTSGFVLSAAVVALFNTALAWAKDASPALNDFMKRVGGHHWTTHGLIDLILFIGLGFAFAQTGVAARIDPKLLTKALIGSTVAAALGLALWYAFF
jgi:hypothetical protein